MFANLIVSGLALAAHTVAFPQSFELAKRQDAHAWQPAGSGDVRSPCPGLNTLANHGYINRNGKGVGKQEMQQGFLDAFGLAFGITSDGGQNALNLQCDGCKTFDLDTMNKPHAIEHDGSMTRLDKQMSWTQTANNFAFNQSVWDSSMDLFGCNTHTNPQLSNHVRNGRFTEAQKLDFAGWFLRADGGSLAEHGFILSSMHDYSTGPLSKPSSRLDWINYWFTNERLPTALGWKKPDTVPVETFNSIVNAIGSSPETSVPAKSVCAPTTTSTSAKPTTTSPTSSSTGSSITSTSKSMTTSSSVPFPANNNTAPFGSGTGTAGTNPTAPIVTSMPTKSMTTSSVPFPAGNSTAPLGSGTGTAGVNPTAPIVTSMPTQSTTSGDKTTSQTVPASVSSSAQAKATELAGPAPSQPDAYHQVLSHTQWDSITEVVYKYTVIIQNICSGLIGSHEVGSMPMPGSGAASGGGAPWMAPMPAPGAASPADAQGTCGCKC